MNVNLSDLALPHTTALLCVGMGAALGGMSRYGFNVLFAQGWVGTAALGTLLVNVIGGFGIGALLAWMAQSADLATNPLFAQALRLLLVTGFLGGFTTFSAFSAESLALLQSGRIGAALWHSGVHVGLSLAATACGAWLVRLGAATT